MANYIKFKIYIIIHLNPSFSVVDGLTYGLTSYLILFPYSQLPLSSFPFTIKIPCPCYLPPYHSPLYSFPSGHVKTPYPSFLSFKYSPQYILPSLQVKNPFPCILLASHSPLYVLPSDQLYSPKPYILFSQKSPIYFEPSPHKKIPQKIISL